MSTALALSDTLPPIARCGMALRCLNFSTKCRNCLNYKFRATNTWNLQFENSNHNAYQKRNGSTTATYNHQDFAEAYAAMYTPTSPLQKTVLTFGSAVISLMDPTRADMIATLSETTGERPIKYVQQKMLTSKEGKQILLEKPRINSSTVDLEKLRKLPANSLGKVYTDFLDKNKVTPDTRLMVQFVDDVELAYVIQRYREVHDLVHALLGMPTNMLGEVTVKWVEAIQTRLPMCIGGALFGAVRLAPRQRKRYLQYYLPWAIQTGNKSEFLLNVYFEKRWEQPLPELLRELQITPLDTESIK